jgi:hypothetical protein
MRQTSFSPSASPICSSVRMKGNGSPRTIFEKIRSADISVVYSRAVDVTLAALASTDPNIPGDLPPINEGPRQLDKATDGDESWVFVVSYLLTLLALIAIFVYIPFASQWAFWVLISLPLACEPPTVRHLG